MLPLPPPTPSLTLAEFHTTLPMLTANQHDPRPSSAISRPNLNSDKLAMGPIEGHIFEVIPEFWAMTASTHYIGGTLDVAPGVGCADL